MQDPNSKPRKPTGSATGFRKKFEDFDAPAVPPPPPPPPPRAPAAPKSPILTSTVRNLRSTLRGKRLGEILVNTGQMTQFQVNEAEQKARISKEYLGQHLVRQGRITPMDLCRALSLQSGLPIMALTGVDIPKSALLKIPVDTMLKHDFVPFLETSARISLAAKHPLSPNRITELESLTGKKIEIFLAVDGEVEDALKALVPEREKQKRKDERLKASLPIWYQICDEFGTNFVGPLYSGQTLDISYGGFRLEGPETSYATIVNARRRETFIRAVLSSQPYEVKAVCSLRYLKKREKLKGAEMPVLMGLQILRIGEKDKVDLKHIHVRVTNSSMRDRMWGD
jgi:hypothetical protein